MAGIASISMYIPTILSSGAFSSRRLNSSVDALSSSDPCVSIMNADIAGGQIVNATKGLSELAEGSKNPLATEFISAEKSLKAMSKNNKVMSTFGKVLNFTADHINPIICATGVVKVATSDNKEKTAFEEGFGIGGMLLGEGIYKKVAGMPYTMKVDDKNVFVENEKLYKLKNNKKELIADKDKFSIRKDGKAVIQRDGLYRKNIFASKTVDALHDYCAVKKLCGKSLKWLPAGCKATGMVGVSIGSFLLGRAGGNLAYDAVKEIA